MSDDVLSDVLRTVRLSGAIFYEVRAADPWVAMSPPGADLGPHIMPGAQHIIAYHVVTQGSCWAELGEGGKTEPIELGVGSIILFPHGDAHLLSSAPGMPAPPTPDAYRLPGADETLPFYIDELHGRPESIRILCGFLACDAQPFNPLLQALPRVVHVGDGYGSNHGSLDSLIKATIAESSRERIGTDSVLSRLSELLFIEVVRRFLESLPQDDPGWLGALIDPCVGRVLRLMHDDPSRGWTLNTLAREAGFSRTVLVERFTSRLGIAPMAYLLKWRMQIAASLLYDGARGTARIASAVGYGSEEAFSRAFKRCTGSSPAQWRKRLAERPVAGTSTTETMVHAAPDRDLDEDPLRS